ncbi:MAG: ASCH domain-containing protein [Pseudomonadota bacterium]
MLTDPTTARFWAQAEAALGPLPRDRLSDIGPFDDNAEGAAYCVAAILDGTKTATSALAATARDYQPGDLEIATEFDGTPRALFEITATDLCPFGEIDEAFAQAEGDGTLAAWRETHLRYYGARLAERGETLTQDTMLRRIFLERLYPV